MCNLVLGEIKSIFNTKKPTLNQIKQYKRSLADLMNNYNEFSNKIKHVKNNKKL